MMHFMSESANTGTRLSERKAVTAAKLTTVSRRLTAAHGLNGFTIEELCDEVGVSRRTFFNYFPSKEDAVIGVNETAQEDALAEEFLSRGSRGWPAVFDDFVSIAAANAEHIGGGLSEHTDFHAALEREPKLLVKFMGMTRQRDQLLASLIATREGVPHTDPRARACVELLGSAAKATMSRVVDEKIMAGECAGEAVVETMRAVLQTFRTVLGPPDDGEVSGTVPSSSS